MILSARSSPATSTDPAGHHRRPRLLPLPGAQRRDRHRHDRGADRRLHDGRQPEERGGRQGSCSTGIGQAAPRSMRTSPNDPAVGRRQQQGRHVAATTRCSRSRPKLVGCGEVHRPVPRPRHQPRLRLQRRSGTALADFLADPSSDRLDPRATSRSRRGIYASSDRWPRLTSSSRRSTPLAAARDAPRRGGPDGPRGDRAQGAAAVSSLSRPRQDGGCALMVGIPTVLHIVLVWIPAICIDRAVVHRLERHPGSATSAGSASRTTGRSSRSSTTTSSRRCSTTSCCWSSCSSCRRRSACCSPTCSTRTSAARASTRASTTSPVVLSLAVVGFIWKSVIYSPRQGLFNDDPRPRQADRLARQPVEDLRSSTPVARLRRSGCRRTSSRILIAIAWRHTGYIMVLYLAGLKASTPRCARRP